jgi:hypothetical protein
MFTNELSPAGLDDEMTIFGRQVNECDAAHATDPALSLFCQPYRWFSGKNYGDPGGFWRYRSSFSIAAITRGSVGSVCVENAAVIRPSRPTRYL